MKGGIIMFASVVINVASSNVDQMYEYAVPSDLAPYIKVGARVNVEFGVGNRLVMGYVLDVYEERKFRGENKVISELLDLKPFLNQYKHLDIYLLTGHIKL